MTRATPYSRQPQHQRRSRHHQRRPSIDLDTQDWNLGRQHSQQPRGLSAAMQQRLSTPSSASASASAGSVFSRLNVRPAAETKHTNNMQGHRRHASYGGDAIRISIANPRAESESMPAAARRPPQQQQRSRAPGGLVSDLMDMDMPQSTLRPLSAGDTVVQLNNLHWEVSERDLREFFDAFGPLKKVRVMYDTSGRSQGKAEMLFSSERAALDAIERFNGANLDGLVLQMAIPGYKIGRSGIVGASSAKPPVDTTAMDIQGADPVVASGRLRRTIRNPLAETSFKIVL